MLRLSGRLIVHSSSCKLVGELVGRTGHRAQFGCGRRVSPFGIDNTVFTGKTGGVFVGPGLQIQVCFTCQCGTRKIEVDGNLIFGSEGRRVDGDRFRNTHWDIARWLPIIIVKGLIFFHNSFFEG